MWCGEDLNKGKDIPIVTMAVLLMLLILDIIILNRIKIEQNVGVCNVDKHAIQKLPP